MSDDTSILERFHRALVEEIQTQRPEYLTGPFTVAEIYQNLTPHQRVQVAHDGGHDLLVAGVGAAFERAQHGGGDVIDLVGGHRISSQG